MTSLFRHLKTILKVHRIKSLLERWEGDTALTGMSPEEEEKVGRLLLRELRGDFPWDAHWARKGESPLPLFVHLFRKTHPDYHPRLPAVVDLVPPARRADLLGACLPWCRTWDDWERLAGMGARVNMPEAMTARLPMTRLLIDHAGDWSGMAEFIREELDFKTPVAPVRVKGPDGQSGGEEDFELFSAFALVGESAVCFDLLLASGFDLAAPVPYFETCSRWSTPRKIQVSAIEFLLFALEYGDLPCSPEEAARRVKVLHTVGCGLGGMPDEVAGLPGGSALQRVEAMLESDPGPHVRAVLEALHPVLAALTEQRGLAHMLPGAESGSRTLSRRL
jgi:hypothetical protein